MYIALDWNYRIAFESIKPLIKAVKQWGSKYVGTGKEINISLLKFRNVDEFYHPNLKNVEFFIRYNFDDELTAITFEWKTPDGVKHRKRVGLTFEPSNLGSGMVGYFLCPVTNRKCRKLYTDGNNLCSRYAFGHRYSYQNESRAERAASKCYRNGEENRERVVEHRQTYRGKPTRWAKKLQKMRNREIEGWGYVMDRICAKRK